MFESKAAKNAFKKFQKFSGSSSNETSVYAFYQSDAVTTHAANCFAGSTNDFDVPSKTNPNNQDRNMEVANAGDPCDKSNSRRGIHHNSALKLRSHLLVTAISFLSTCSGTY